MVGGLVVVVVYCYVSMKFRSGFEIGSDQAEPKEEEKPGRARKSLEELGKAGQQPEKSEKCKRPEMLLSDPLW